MPVKPYTKKAEQVDALEYTGTNYQEMMDFCPELTFNPSTTEIYWGGLIKLTAGDYIAKDLSGIYSRHVDFLTYYRPGGGP